MQIKIIAVNDAPVFYNISNEEINGIDLSSFPEGASYIGTSFMRESGIWGLDRVNGELHVTIGQHGLPYECNPDGNNHEWQGVNEWVDANDFDPDSCYIVAASAPEGAEYIRRENGWTVAMPQTEEPSA
ncbi:hypothetical protein [Vreelandella titanicae]|uniref:hypothetical protein n=1 Tax=Vreelandella titanicae TaxID=664683 RepID=UPI00241CE021|nr:hypothetical protein [Halomonas titanicae]